MFLKNTKNIHIPSECTFYRVIEEIGLSDKPKGKPNGITKAYREAMKSDDILKCNFKVTESIKKVVTDIEGI